MTAWLIAACCLFVVVLTWALRRLFPRQPSPPKPVPELDEWGVHTLLDYALIASLERDLGCCEVTMPVDTHPLACDNVGQSYTSNQWLKEEL